MSDRPYPDGIAWDEALRQRMRADRLEQQLAKLREEASDALVDLHYWKQLAQRQHDEMEHNEPLCPTSDGIEQTKSIIVKLGKAISAITESEGDDE